MARKSGQRTAWLIVIVISLGLIGAEPSDTAWRSSTPQTATDSRDTASQGNHAEPLKGSPELWKFRFIIDK